MILKRKVKGVGGLFFLAISGFCAFIMITTINLSRMSTMLAISDNVAHIVATKIAISSYNANSSSYSLNGNPAIKTSSGDYYPLEDFNKIIKDYGFMTANAPTAEVKWDYVNKVASFYPGAFSTSMGEKIRPKLQTTKIENE